MAKANKRPLAKHAGRVTQASAGSRTTSRQRPKERVRTQKAEREEILRPKTPKEKCQICGKTNHTADKCYLQYVVNELRGLMSRPTLRAWEAAKHLVTKDHALFFDEGTDNCDHITVIQTATGQLIAKAEVEVSCAHLRWQLSAL